MFAHQKFKIMKKITMLMVFLASLTGFSQTNKQIIQAYFDNNRAKNALTNKDVADWTIEKEVPGSGTKITSCYVAQRYQGIEIYNAQSNVALKDGKVFQYSNGFVSNIVQKVNATVKPVLSVTEAISRAYNLLENASANFSIVETKSEKSFVLSDGIHEEPIPAKLVYQLTADNNLKLAWSFLFYSADAKRLWAVRIDAVNGQILEKNDLVISCSFGGARHHEAAHAKEAFSFYKSGFKAGTESMLAVNAGSYRVIPYNQISPNHSPFQLITSPSNALASPNGWHNANTIGGTNQSLIFTHSRGNNAFVQEDANGNNGNGIRAEGGASLAFDFSYGGQSALPTSYTSAASTNLFYMANIIHDVWYQYGFDEASGNFQQNNLGRGGVTTPTGDAILGDSQDGYSQKTPTLNNASFSPQNDGVSPKIQMFMWNLGAPAVKFITVNSPAAIAGEYPAVTNNFKTTDAIPVPVAPNGITSDLILYTNTPNPGSNPVTAHNGCLPPTNVIRGKIALLRRGNCGFSDKVKNAQDAGALAVIVYDTVPNNPLRISMNSEAVLGITIPAIFVSKEIGDSFIAQLASGPVNVKLETPANLYLYADGDFDNGIIGHEYGHGISTRLIGGGNAACMTNLEQAGEGWSDWFSLMMQIKAGDVGATPIPIGTYAINQPNDGKGIRTLLGSADSPDYSYSTDMTLNPLTLKDSNYPYVVSNNYRYELGDVWASMMWDLTWAYIDKYGFDPDIYNGTGGNNKVMRLALDALKLEVCNRSSFVSMRNHLFAADQATTGGADYCMIAEVFRRRGLGSKASSGSAAVNNDQVEDFTAFPPGPNCTLGVNYFEAKDNFKVYPNPSDGTFNIRINQFVGKVNFQVVDVNGRTVYTQNNQDFNIEKTINLNNLQTGMYILKVSNGDTINYTQKIIIK